MEALNKITTEKIPVLIRKAGIEDVKRITDLARHTFYETYAPFNTLENMERYMDEQLNEDCFSKRLQDRGNTFFLAYFNDVLAGYVQLDNGSCHSSFKEIHSVEIARFYAIPQMIGKGIGHALMQRSVEHAKENNCKVIWLIVWQENKRAIAFYKKYGFEIIDTHVFKLGDDLQNDWVMKMQL